MHGGATGAAEDATGTSEGAGADADADAGDGTLVRKTSLSSWRGSLLGSSFSQLVKARPKAEKETKLGESAPPQLGRLTPRKSMHNVLKRAESLFAEHEKKREELFQVLNASSEARRGHEPSPSLASAPTPTPTPIHQVILEGGKPSRNILGLRRCGLRYVRYGNA